MGLFNKKPKKGPDSIVDSDNICGYLFTLINDRISLNVRIKKKNWNCGLYEIDLKKKVIRIQDHGFDMYEHDEELTNFIKQLKTLRNEVIVLHLIGNNELEFNYKGTLTFEDLETGSKLKVDSKLAKDNYIKLLEEKIKKIKNLLLSNNISYQMFDLKEPLGEALKLFLKRRNNLM